MTTEQQAVLFVTGMQVRNAAGTKTAQPENQEELHALLEKGWEIVPQITPPSPNKSTTGKRRITKEQAKASSDANLSESFGMPSALAAQPIGFKFQVKVVGFIEQPKRNGNGVFPSTQVEYNGVRFCILFDERHDENLTLNCNLADAGLRPDGTPVTRSGKTVEVIY